MSEREKFLYAIFKVEASLFKGRNLDVVCKEAGITTRDYQQFKEKHKNFATTYSIGDSLPEGKIHLKRRKWFQNQEDISKALKKAQKLGVSSKYILDLCFLTYYSTDPNGFERHQIEADIKQLKDAAKTLNKASKIFKTDSNGIWRPTDWTAFRLEKELNDLKCVQIQLEQIATGFESYLQSTKLPKRRPYHWEDINRAVDLSSPNPRQYLQFESIRAQKIILRLAALFRSAPKSKGPQDRLSLVFVTKIMNFGTKTNVHLDLESFSKMRRTLEKRKGALLPPKWIENFKKPFKRNPKKYLFRTP